MAERKRKKKQGIKKRKKRITIWVRIRNFFTTTLLGGIVVVLPITILILLIDLLYRFIANILEPIRKLINIPYIEAEWLINLVALSFVLIAFFVIGLIVQTNLGKQTFKAFEGRFLSQIPFYNIIRETIQQFFSQEQVPFSQVISVDVFNNSTRMIGFISDDLEDNRHAVFVPTGPNPTNGFIFIVHKSQIEYLDVRPEEAMRSIIGVGTSAAELYKAGKKTSSEEE